MNKSLAVFVSAAALAAQDRPVRNWPAPLDWQPSAAEAGHMRPELRAPSPKATTPAGALVFVAMTPCRIVDTRSSCLANPNLCGNAQFGPPSLSTNTTRSFPIQSSSTCWIPANAMAYSFNVTMIPNPTGSFAGFVTVWNTAVSPNTPPTTASILDFPTADIRSNAVIVPAGISNGSVSVITNATNPLDVTFDINGYFTPLTGITLTQGTAGAPSLSFSGDVGTGIFSPGAGIVNITSGTASALTVGGANHNTAIGVSSLVTNTTGTNNTAIGYQALRQNTTGADNTASGYQALLLNTTGTNNTASGRFALQNNSMGSANTAVGSDALISNTAGTSNTALGDLAGNQITLTGSNNIDIRSHGTTSDGTSANTGVIRIGIMGEQTSFFAAGINNSTVSGAIVLVDGTSGRLGIASSSRRYKEDIEDLGDDSSGLMRLRPVKFRYRKPYADGSKPLDYGLIAEEVAEVYPGLVVKNKDGQAETVQYHKLIPMLLNELQKLEARVGALEVAP